MKEKLADVYKVARRRYRRERLMRSLNYGTGDREFFLVSYPRSGNTWLRVILGYLLSAQARSGSRDVVAFHNVGNYVPDSHQEGQLAQVLDRTSDFFQLPVQVVKSHDSFGPFYWGKKVIYVVRDGRDVIRSYFHYMNARTKSFIAPEAFVEGNTSRVMSWSRHVLGWHKTLGKGNLLVRYEDLKANPEQEVVRIAEYLGLVVTPGQVAEAVQEAAFENMKKRERTHGYFNDDRTEDGKKSPFVRQGVSGEREGIFTNDQIARFEQLSRKALSVHGYDT